MLVVEIEVSGWSAWTCRRYASLPHTSWLTRITVLPKALPAPLRSERTVKDVLPGNPALQMFEHVARCDLKPRGIGNQKRRRVITNALQQLLPAGCPKVVSEQWVSIVTTQTDVREAYLGSMEWPPPQLRRKRIGVQHQHRWLQAQHFRDLRFERLCLSDVRTRVFCHSDR